MNLAGMIAANVLRGLHPVSHWEDIEENKEYILDVRTEREYNRDHFPNAVNIPLDTLRDRLEMIPGDRKIFIYCETGQRSYYAERILLQNGFSPINIVDGYILYKALLINNRV